MVKKTNSKVNSSSVKRKNILRNKNLSLKERMKMKLKASHFRYINEQLYTSTGLEAKELFENNSGEFSAYHAGYRQQLSEWPINPVDVIINQIRRRINKSDRKLVVADFGCGDAKIARTLSEEIKTYSFDLVALNDHVTVSDMASTFLFSGSIDIAVFCLSLMGTNLSSYIREANRVLKLGGLLKIADVESRFVDVNSFINDVEKFGFKTVHNDFSHNMFYFLSFKKVSVISKHKKKKLPDLKLNPCLYKKR